MESLDTALIVAVAASLVAWGLVSAKFESVNISAPMAFVAIGLVLATDPLSAIDVNVRGDTLRSLAEITSRAPALLRRSAGEPPCIAS